METTLTDSVPQATPGSRLRINLTGVSRTTGGAFQIWRAEELLFQGSSYGMPPPDPSPDLWRPIGLVSRTGDTYSISLYIPITAEAGEYELRLASTIGSRSGVFQVTAAPATAE